MRCLLLLSALLGAGSVLTANVPAYGLVFGNPARQAGWVCRCGDRLTFKGSAAYCSACGQGYRATGHSEIVEA